MQLVGLYVVSSAPASTWAKISILREQILVAASKETAVGGEESRFFQDPYELEPGRSDDAARGLVDRMQVDQFISEPRCTK